MLPVSPRIVDLYPKQEDFSLLNFKRPSMTLDNDRAIAKHELCSAQTQSFG